MCPGETKVRVEHDMTEIVTVPERQAREAARGGAAARRVMDAIKEFGAAHGGRYHVFGSAAAHRKTFDSDFNVLVDFPPERESEAAEFVENACRSAGIPFDVYLKSTASPRFLDRIRSRMIALP
jgi:predicted nucleotidyltransferase